MSLDTTIHIKVRHAMTHAMTHGNTQTFITLHVEERDFEDVVGLCTTNCNMSTTNQDLVRAIVKLFDQPIGPTYECKIVDECGRRFTIELVNEVNYDIDQQIESRKLFIGLRDYRFTVCSANHRPEQTWCFQCQVDKIPHPRCEKCGRHFVPK